MHIISAPNCIRDETTVGMLDRGYNVFAFIIKHLHATIASKMFYPGAPSHVVET